MSQVWIHTHSHELPTAHLVGATTTSYSSSKGKWSSDIWELFILLHSPFSVKWNFVGNGEKQLPLEVGDTVFIQEACDGKKNNDIKIIIIIKYKVSA